MQFTIGILLLGLALGSNGQAAEQCYSWGCQAKIRNLYLNSSGDLYIGFPSNISLAPIGCPLLSGVYATLKTSEPNFKAVYATLLSAKLTDKVILVKMAEGQSGCPVQYVVLE